MKTLAICLLVLETTFSYAKDACHEIDIANILPIGYQLATEANEESYTMFIFEEDGDFTSDEQLNIQFSIENKKFGLDWVLKAPRNIKDADKFKQYAEKNGYEVMKKKMNGVEYLRVETGGSLFTLCKGVITGLYSISEQDKICFVYSGIEF